MTPKMRERRNKLAADAVSRVDSPAARDTLSTERYFKKKMSANESAFKRERSAD